jgi:hypothetical protein
VFNRRQSVRPKESNSGIDRFSLIINAALCFASALEPLSQIFLLAVNHDHHVHSADLSKNANQLKA